MRQRSQAHEETRSRGYVAGCLVAAFFFSLIVVAGATQWFPSGAAGIDHIVLPALSFPLVWLGFAIGLLAAQRRGRAWGTAVLIVVLSSGAMAAGLSGVGT